MRKKNSRRSALGHSSRSNKVSSGNDKKMTSVMDDPTIGASSSKNILQDEFVGKFKNLSILHENTTAKTKEPAAVGNVIVGEERAPSGKKHSKKSSRSGGQKKGNKNIVGAMQIKKAVVVEINESTVVAGNRRATGKDNKKNFTTKNESMVEAAKEEVENFAHNVQYASYDGVFFYPAHHYHPLYYQGDEWYCHQGYAGYYHQNEEGYHPSDEGYSQSEGFAQPLDHIYYYPFHYEMAYHHQYALNEDHLRTLNIHAPVFEPNGQSAR